MSDLENELTASYHRCIHDGRFIDTFYQLFLSKSSAIAEKFANTDFDKQKLMLRQSLLEILCYEHGITGANEEIERLGHRHRELGISPDMYMMWLDALCEAIKKHDPKYTPEVEKLWRIALQKPIEAMISGNPLKDS